MLSRSALFTSKYSKSVSASADEYNGRAGGCSPSRLIRICQVIAEGLLIIHIWPSLSPRPRLRISQHSRRKMNHKNTDIVGHSELGECIIRCNYSVLCNLFFLLFFFSYFLKELCGTGVT